MSEEKNSTLHSQNSKLIRSSAAEYLTFVASTGYNLPLTIVKSII